MSPALLRSRSIALRALASVAVAASALAPHPSAAGPARSDSLLALEARDLTLQNGLLVILVKGAPGSGGAVLATFDAGEASLSPDRQGAALLAARCLRGGSAELPREALEAAITTMGARFVADATHDVVEVGLEAAPDSLAAAAALLATLLEAPAYPDDVVLAEKERLLGEVSDSTDSEGAARRLLTRILYDRHPYTQRPTPASVEKIAAGDLRAFHARRMGARNATVVVAGELGDDDALLRAVRRAFETLPAGEPSRAERFVPPPQTRRRVFLLHLPGEERAAVAVGNGGLRAGDPDELAAALLGRVLGAPAAGRVAARLVSQEHLATHVEVGFESRRQSGLFLASAASSPASIDSCAAALLEELERARYDAPLPDEVERAAGGVSAEWGARTAKAMGLARETAAAVGVGRGPAWPADFEAALARVGSLEIARAGRRLVRPYTAPLVFAGDGPRLAPRIVRFGEVLWYDAAGEPIPRAAIPTGAESGPSPTGEPREAGAGAGAAAAGAAVGAGAAAASGPGADSALVEPPVLLDTAPFRGGEETTYRMLLGGLEIGTLTARVSEEEWDERPVFACHVSTEGGIHLEVAVAFSADTMSPLSSHVAVSRDSVIAETTLQYGSGRVWGRDAASGQVERTIEAELPDGTVDAAMLPYVIRALPGEGPREFSLRAWSAKASTPIAVRVAFGGLEEVPSPSGTVIARKVEVTGSEVAGTYYLDESPRRRIVSATMAGTGLTIRLK